jgi:hypothetical protein
VNPTTGYADEPSTRAVDAYQKQFNSEVVSMAMFHPDPRTWVITIASTNPPRTTDALGSTYPDELCVVRSRFLTAELRAALSKATTLLPPDRYGVTGVGQTVRPDGQPAVDIDVVRDTPELRDALQLSSLPPGLVEIVPWLQPVPPQG